MLQEEPRRLRYDTSKPLNFYYFTEHVVYFVSTCMYVCELFLVERQKACELFSVREGLAVAQVHAVWLVR